MAAKHKYIFLAACFAGETFFATYGLLIGPTAVAASIGYLLAGAGVVAGLLLVPEISFRVPEKTQWPERFGKILLFAVVIALAVLTATYWFDRIDVDPDYADMLPVIKVMNERLLAGQRIQVYNIIPELWGGTQPIYLPAMWMPYLAAIGLGGDMRWTTVVSLLICFGVFLWLLPLEWKKGSFYLVLAAAALLFWWLFGEDDRHGVIALSEEGPVILYYFFLCLALVSGNPFCIGGAILLCGLSRYSFAGWLPAFALILFARRRYRQAGWITVTAVAGFLLLFLLPFGWHPIQAMMKLPGNYTEFAARVWKDSPETFWVNLGLAKFFGEKQVALLHHCLLYAGLSLPALFAAFCVWKGKGRWHNLPLAMLKFSLLVFYQLVDVPYGYLFYTASFVSLAAVVLAIRSGQSVSDLRIA